MTQIKERQNEDISLNTQYAARYYFNQAEIYNFVVWILCLVSLLSVTIPATAPNTIVYGFPLVVDLSATLGMILFNKYVNLGAQIRAAFDDYVLGFSDELLMKQSLKEYVLKAITKNPAQVQIQKKHTGNDTPPGVRDWYNVNSGKTDLEDVLSCQKENVWWEKKLLVRKMFFCSALTIACIGLFLLLKLLCDISLWRIILSSALLIRICERICENIRCFYISNKIDGQIELLEVQKTTEQLKLLQATINEKRSLKIVGINFIHKTIAAKLSNIYEKTKN